MKVLNGQISARLDNGMEVGYLPILQETAQLKANTTVVFAWAKNMKKLTSGQEIRNKALTSLISTHVTKNEDGSPSVVGIAYQFDSEEIKAEYIQKVTELQMMDSGIVLHRITEADARSMVGITSRHIELLGDIIIMEEEEEELPVAAPALEAE